MIGCSQGRRLIEVVPDSNARYWSDAGFTAHREGEGNRALAADIAALTGWTSGPRQERASRRIARPIARAPLDAVPHSNYLAGKRKDLPMSQFDDRDRAFEAKFARDEEMQFRIIARRNRLLGEWAARLMGLSEAETEAYAKDVVRADFEEAGDEDVIRKVLGDLTAAGVEIDEEQIREALEHKTVEARRQMIEHKPADADGRQGHRGADPRRDSRRARSRSAILPATATIMRRGSCRRASPA